MTKSTSMARTGLLAVLLAMVGFSYSLATSNTDSEGIDTAPRAVGTQPPLAFANPFVTGGTDRDLGDAVAGSALTRLVRAKGGIPPYKFVAGSTPVGQATTLATAQLQLLADGILTTVGTATSKTIPAGPFRFLVTVTDCAGTAPHKVTEMFRLTFVTTTRFRFAASTLPDGYQYTPYSATVPTINGKPTITYTVSGTGLNSTGLALSKDGNLFGIPIVPSVTFIAVATDAAGKLAANRVGIGASQTFTVVFAANKKISTTIAATSITIKTGFGTSKDSVSFKGVADLGSATIASLSGQAFSLRIGTYTAPTANFDSKGHASSAKGSTPTLKVGLKKFGLLGASVNKGTISLGTITSSTVQLPVEVRLGNAVIGSEFLTFSVKTGRTGQTLTYKGDISSDTGGTAQLLKVLGSDDKAGTGDAWKVGFLARFPAFENVGSSNAVKVSIGTNYSNTISLSNKNGKLTGKANNNDPVITSFALDTTKKGKGGYTTGLISKTSTAIPLASKPGTVQATFATNLTFMGGTTSAQMDGCLAIFANKTKWASQ